MSDILKARCSHCGGELEFDAPDAGAIAACPLCGRDTVLEPVAEVGVAATGESAPNAPASPGKSRRALAIVGTVVLLLALGGTAAAIIAKRSNSNGKSAGTANGKPAKSTGATASANEPVKDVTPVVTKFQAGLGADKIRRGREVFLSSCAECHRLYDPAFYTATQWANTLGSMRGKAKLNGAQYDDLQTFVKTLRE
jgi:mono/diheme cytochrome c family protein